MLIIPMNHYDYLHGVYKHSTFLTPATTDEIRKIIEHLKNSSPEWDGIKPNIIKHVYSSLLEPLCHIVNLAFHKGYVPDQQKIANIVPIFKNGDAASMFLIFSKD